MGFDVGRTSDFDIGLASESLFARAKQLGIDLRTGKTRTGPLRISDLKNLGLRDFQSSLRERMGRDIKFMIFYSSKGVFDKAPSIAIPR